MEDCVIKISISMSLKALLELEGETFLSIVFFKVKLTRD